MKKPLFDAVQDALARGYRATSEGHVYGPSGKRIGSNQGSGYITIGFKDSNGHHHGPYAHRFIWMALKGDIPAGYDINHINHIKSDNRIENLECISHVENMRHTAKEGKGGGGRGVTRKPDISQLLEKIEKRDAMITRLYDIIAEYHRGGRLSTKDFNALAVDIADARDDHWGESEYMKAFFKTPTSE